MKRLLLPGVAALLGLLLAPVAATAMPITFEGFENTTYYSPITRLGYDIGNPPGQEQHFHEINSMGYGLPPNGTGVLLNDRNTEIFVTAAFGMMTPFRLLSVDVATARSNGPAVGIAIRGYLGGNPTGRFDLPDLGTGYTNLPGVSLGIVDYLIFDGIGGSGGFVLDNLDLSSETGPPIPEPGSMLLLGTGLVGMGRAWRKRRG